MKKLVLILLVAAIIFSEFVFTQSKIVYIDQKLSTGDRIGTLKKYEGSIWSDSFIPNTPFDFPLYSQQTILGDQAIYTGQKYNNWNDDFSDVKNFHSFQITPLTNILTSKFGPTNTGITIKTSLEGTEAT